MSDAGKDRKPCDCGGYVTELGFLHAETCERASRPFQTRFATPGEWEVVETLSGDEHTLLIRGNGRTCTVALKVLWAPSARELRQARADFALICCAVNGTTGHASGANDAQARAAISKARGV